jgi:hypothetical protein
VRPGDVVWVVTIRAAELCLHARIEVDHVGTFAEARRRLRRRHLWPSAVWVFARSEHVNTREIAIGHLVRGLRFVSRVSDRLRVVTGRITPTRLQTLRRLTPSTATRLDRAWRHAQRLPTRR